LAGKKQVEDFFLASALNSNRIYSLFYLAIWQVHLNKWYEDVYAEARLALTGRLIYYLRGLYVGRLFGSLFASASDKGQLQASYCLKVS
jgi:hypothetical protein